MRRPLLTVSHRHWLAGKHRTPSHIHLRLRCKEVETRIRRVEREESHMYAHTYSHAYTRTNTQIHSLAHSAKQTHTVIHTHVAHTQRQLYTPRGFARSLKSFGSRVRRCATRPFKLNSPLLSLIEGCNSWMGLLLFNSYKVSNVMYMRVWEKIK
jgi:hypothetical protein